MKVVVFGANGKVGRLVVAKLLDNGYDVRAYVHSSAPFANDPKLEVVEGDVYDKTSVASAVRGCDAVMSTLGSWGTPKKDILTIAMQHIIPAMKTEGITKIVTLTGAASNAQGDYMSLLHNVGHALFAITAGKILEDGENHLAQLQGSGLDWSTLRSPIMNGSGNPTTYKLTNQRPADWKTINRQSVALGMIELLESDQYHQQAPFIAR